MTEERIATREEMIEEAVSRMKVLSLHNNTITEFVEEGILNKSESVGILYFLNEEELEVVKELEQEYNGIVYHCIYVETDFGRLLSMLYVSADKRDWEEDREDLKQNYVYAATRNLSDRHILDFGCIGIKRNMGGLIRTA